MKHHHRVPLALVLAVAATLRAQEPTAVTPPATRSPSTGAPVTTMPTVDVVGQTPTAYGPPPTTSFTGLTAPIRELPYTVNTVTDQFISDTSTRRTRDLVGYIPGVNASEDSGAIGDLLNIRGFDFIYQTYVNGMRNRIGYNASKSLGNIERIEIFKGPGGVEFGDGDPGGFVNYVTKKPQEKASITLGVEAGSWDYIGGYLDATGPLWAPPNAATTRTDKDGKSVATDPAHSDLGVFYRLIVSGDSSASFRDAFHTDGVLAAPSILWKYAEGSSVLFEAEYLHRDQPYDRGIMYLEGAGYSGNFAPLNRSYHEPSDYLDTHQTRVSLYWTHKFSEYFTFRLTGEMNTSDSLGKAVRNPLTYLLYIPGTNQWNGDRTVQRTTQTFDGWDYSFGVKPEFLINFETGPLKHSGLLGFNYLDSRTFTSSADGFDSRPIDLFKPVYGLNPIKRQPADPTDPTSIPPGARDFRFEEMLDEYGVYYQHKIDVFSRVHLLGGVRYDWYQDKTAVTRNVRATPLPPLAGTYDDSLSWRVGGVVDVTKNLSAFVGLSNSFQPQQGLTSDGSNVQPLEARSFEAGLKTSFFDGRLQATASVYQTTRKNLLEADPNDPTGVFVKPLGTVRVQGVELEVTGQITRDLDVQGGFSLMDSKITATDDLTTLGREFYNVPNVQVGLRLRYDTSRWLIPGLSVGGGVVYVGDRAGDAQNSFTLPDYWRFDAGVYYTWRNWKFKVTCENLADERYFLASQGEADIIQPGAPRTFVFGAQVTF
ncbi:MAG TPA: TonB-dependent receptor [Chthoniobacter sp.]|nr:TonB-dependent receptor [Chthoniobacter sp.]